MNTVTVSTDRVKTVPDGAFRQTLTAADRSLALIPGTAGGTVSVTINGQTYTNPDSITVSAGDTVTASGGVCVYRLTVPHTYAGDGSDCFRGVKCAVVGDSIMAANGGNLNQAVKWWEMLSGEYESRSYVQKGSGNVYKCEKLMTGLSCYNGKNLAGGYYAIGGTGYWSSKPFYIRLENLHHDADVVILYGSVNDWTFRTAGKTGEDYVPNDSYGASRGKFFRTDSMQAFTNQLTWAEPCADDLRVDGELHYFSQYIAKAIMTAHRNAPLAKIIVVNPWAYPAGENHSLGRGNRATQDGDWTRYVMCDYIRRTVPGASDWLLYRYESCDFSGTTYADGRYTKAEGGFQTGPMQVPDWNGGGGTVPFGYYPYEYGANFQTLYACPWDSGYPHPNTLSNEVCFAPRMAHHIADAVGVPYANLPAGLKYPDDGDTPEPPEEPDEPETYETRIYDASGHAFTSMSRLHIRHGGQLVQPARVFDCGKHEINIGG